MINKNYSTVILYLFLKKIPIEIYEYIRYLTVKKQPRYLLLSVRNFYKQRESEYKRYGEWFWGK